MFDCPHLGHTPVSLRRGRVYRVPHFTQWKTDLCRRASCRSASTRSYSIQTVKTSASPTVRMSEAMMSGDGTAMTRTERGREGKGKSHRGRKRGGRLRSIKTGHAGKAKRRPRRGGAFMGRGSTLTRRLRSWAPWPSWRRAFWRTSCTPRRSRRQARSGRFRRRRRRAGRACRCGCSRRCA